MSDLHGIVVVAPDGGTRLAAGAGKQLAGALLDVGIDLGRLATGNVRSLSGRPHAALTPVGQVQTIAWPLPAAGGSGRDGDRADWLFVLSRRLPRIILIARRLAALALTAREREVALALYGPETLPEIGRRLGLRASTITDHRRGLYAKLELHSRGDLRRLLDAEQAAISPPDAAR